MKRILKYIGELFLALVVVASTYHVWYLNKTKKEFKLSIEDYKKEKEFTIFNIQIENTGNQPLLKSDFSTDISFNTRSLELSEIKTLNSTPTNLHLDFIRTYKNEIKLTSELYNPNDKCVIQIITVGKLDTLLIDGRIIGVDEIKLELNDKLQVKPVILFSDLESTKYLEIIKATYGYSNKVRDVTEILNNNIKDNSLIVGTSFGFDPYPNKVKTLKIKYLYNGFVDSVSIKEGRSIKLPRNKN